MDHFKIPIIIQSEARKTIKAELNLQRCLIKTPRSLLLRKRQMLTAIDHVYWRLIIRLNTPRLIWRTKELNNCYFRFQFKAVRYHRQLRRWGSCSSLKNLNLSHRLIGAPTHLEDYVIIHELAHLQYMNHSKQFWDLVKVAVPEPGKIRKQIIDYGLEWHNSYKDWLENLKKLI